MFPFIVFHSSAVLFAVDRLDTESKAYPVGVLADMFQSRLVIVEFMSVNAVSIYYEMIMQMSLIKVSGNNYLTIITEGFSCKGFCDSVSQFGRNIVLRVKRLNIMNGFNSSFSFIRHRLIETLAAELFIYHFHIHVSVFSIAHTIQ